MKKIIALLAAALTLAAPATANPYAAKAEARVLHGWTQADGTHIAAVEITLADGWKTYWRAPGDAGIPPLFKWTGSRNLSDVSVRWPRPIVFDQNGMRSIGYTERLVLPVILTPKRTGKDIRLKGRLSIGVCQDICVPLELNIEANLQAGAVADKAHIDTALANVPASKKHAAHCSISQGERGLLVTVETQAPPLGGREAAAVETGDPLIWASEPRLTREGGTVRLTTELIHALGKAFALDRSALRITLLGSKDAVDLQGCG